jgi:hypothetical protein
MRKAWPVSSRVTGEQGAPGTGWAGWLASFSEVAEHGVDDAQLTSRKPDYSGRPNATGLDGSLTNVFCARRLFGLVEGITATHGESAFSHE